MTKQTAVDWLFDNLTIEVPTVRRFKKKTIVRNLSVDELKKLINQAKEMDKQNMIDAYEEGRGDDGGEDYYNQTFNQ